jgi:hypothetical protein
VYAARPQDRGTIALVQQHARAMRQLDANMTVPKNGTGAVSPESRR